jgi:hypothetical protein
MCVISDKLKFCACKSLDYTKLKHYWVLYTYVGEKATITIGQVMMPFSFWNEDYKTNKHILLARLKESDTFDQDMSFRAKDILEVVINNQAAAPASTFSFYFQFSKGRWIETDLDHLDIENHFDLRQFGKIKGAL